MTYAKCCSCTCSYQEPCSGCKLLAKKSFLNVLLRCFLYSAGNNFVVVFEFAEPTKISSIEEEVMFSSSSEPNITLQFQASYSATTLLTCGTQCQ